MRLVVALILGLNWLAFVYGQSQFLGSYSLPNIPSTINPTYIGPEGVYITWLNGGYLYLSKAQSVGAAPDYTLQYTLPGGTPIDIGDIQVRGNEVIIVGAVDLGGGSTGGFFLRLDTAGNADTFIVVSAPFNPKFKKVTFPKSGGYVIGGELEDGSGVTDLLVVWMDSFLTIVDMQAIGGTQGENLLDIAVDSFDRVGVLGSTYSFNASQSDYYFVAFDTTGRVLCTNAFGSPGAEAFYGSVTAFADGWLIGGNVDPQSNFTYTGFLATIDSQCTIRWLQGFRGSSIDVIEMTVKVINAAQTAFAFALVGGRVKQTLQYGPMIMYGSLRAVGPSLLADLYLDFAWVWQYHAYQSSLVAFSKVWFNNEFIEAFSDFAFDLGGNGQYEIPIARRDTDGTVSLCSSDTSYGTNCDSVIKLPPDSLGLTEKKDSGTNISPPFSPAGGGVTVQPAGTDPVPIDRTAPPGYTCDLCPEPCDITVVLDSIHHNKCAGDSSGAIFISVVGGTPPITYSWNTGSTQEDISGLPAGKYVVVVSDANNCVDDDSFFVNEPPPLGINLDTLVHVRCPGDSANGSIKVSGTGGTPPYTYAWDHLSSPPPHPQYVSGLSPGQYKVTVTDSNGCTAKDSFIIEPPDPPFVEVSNLENIMCNGQDSGKISVIASGGRGPLSYQWFNSNGNPVGTGTTLSNVPAGTYTLIVTDVYECQYTYSFTLTEPPPLTVQLDSITYSCDRVSGMPSDLGDMTGNIYVTVEGGTPPYRYSWNGSNTVYGSRSAEDLLYARHGTYYITVTDVLGCQAQGGPYTVSPPSLPLVLLVDSVVYDCSGQYMSIYVSILGGKPPFRFQWSNGARSQNLLNVPTGKYWIEVVDSNGCKASKVIFPPERNDSLAITGFDIKEPNCGMANGSITVLVSGGKPPYTYSWNTGATTPTINNVKAGVYTVHVADSRGCMVSEVVTLSDSGSLMVMGVERPPKCTGVCDGFIYVYGRGGKPPYSYQWTHGPTQQRLTGVCAGTYTVTVTDSRECVATARFDLIPPDSMFISDVIVKNPTCNNLANGHLLVQAYNGTLPYRYTWSNGVNGQDNYGIGPGVYTVTVTDANGCTTQKTYVLTAKDSVTISLDSLRHPTCSNDSTGAIFISVNSTGSNVVVEWYEQGNWNQVIGYGTSIQNLTAGTYTVIARDLNTGCYADATFTLQSNPSPVIDSFSVSDASACGASDGTVTVHVSGGTPPYTYRWNTIGGNAVGNAQTINNLAPGVYMVEVEDANGCITGGSVFVNSQQNNMSVILDRLENTKCFGSSDGKIEITVQGGTPPYAYQWSDGSNQEDRQNLAPGVYTVQVTDANGCKAMGGPWRINQPSRLVILVTDIKYPTCNGDSDGFIEITAIGGTPGYQYQWSTGSVFPFIANVPSGTYVVQVTDANGCNAVRGIFLPDRAPIDITFQYLDTPTCATDTGFVIAHASGGTGPYTYVWHDYRVGPRRRVVPGVYTVRVTDINGCTGQKTLVVTDNYSLTIDSVKITSPSACGASDGTATVYVSGGQGNYTYQWSNGDTTQTADSLSAGVYIITVRDSLCSVADTIIVNDPGSPTITLDSLKHITCANKPNGAVYISVSGGTPPYSYQWNNGSTTQDIDSLNPGMYVVLVTDANGCTAASYYVLKQLYDSLKVQKYVYNVDCAGNATGSALVSVSGGVLGYSIVWTSGDTTFYIDSLTAGAYGFTVTDSIGCSLEDSVVITEPAPIAITLDSVISPDCAGHPSGALLITVSGGTSPYIYTWSNGSTFEDLQGVPGGAYTLTVQDGHNCAIQKTFTLPEPAPLVVVIDTTGIPTLKAITTGGTTPYYYQWSTGDTTQNITISADGTYWVAVLDMHGCEAYDTVNVQLTGLDIPHNNIKCKVIPKESYLEIVCSQTISEQVYLTDAGGRFIASCGFNNSNVCRMPLPQQGIYLVNVANEIHKVLIIAK